MKIMTILGTRPEIIRLSRVMSKLDDLCEHIIVHTGQNYDKNLNEIFFEDLGLRKPDVVIESKSDSLGGQLAKIFEGVEKALNEYKPDKVLVLGDTNTALSAVIAERLGYPVYHMEAGNRCYDLKVPEEKNRKVIDAVSSFNLPYTPNSKDNLLKEGCAKDRVFETGNPIFEVISHHTLDVRDSNVLERFGLNDRIVLVTAHRAENVDSDYRLTNIITALTEISKDYKVIFSCHPRTKNRIDKLNIEISDNIIITEPLGFFDFLRLEQEAMCAISDSGTVQEECCIFRVPTVTIRDSTERPETVECGSNIVSGLETKDIINCFNIAKTMETNWEMPVGYEDHKVSDKVINFLFGKQFIK